LVVDDSAFARKVIRESLSSSPEIQVLDIARDGLEALEKIVEVKPDVVTLDLMMPNLDGIGVLRSLSGEHRPRVLIVSSSTADSALVAEALAAGAVDMIHKPTSHASDRLYEMRDLLVEKIRQTASANLSATELPVAPPTVATAKVATTTELIVIGTSTGGPQALARLLTALPATLPPIAIALHIPGEYTAAMAERLDRSSALTVLEATDMIEMPFGRAVLARGGAHLEVRRATNGLIGRVRERDQLLYAPSVDTLFKSAVETCGNRVLAVVLTGMGDDGLAGARAIRNAGGSVIAESERSAVIDGMPRVVRQAGLANDVATLQNMAEAILRNL
jgi:two-component system chemotaxis response regulator CheB